MLRPQLGRDDTRRHGRTWRWPKPSSKCLSCDVSLSPRGVPRWSLTGAVAGINHPSPVIRIASVVVLKYPVKTITGGWREVAPLGLEIAGLNSKSDPSGVIRVVDLLKADWFRCGVLMLQLRTIDSISSRRGYRRVAAVEGPMPAEPLA